jgi:hypothetical protein
MAINNSFSLIMVFGTIKTLRHLHYFKTKFDWQAVFGMYIIIYKLLH